MIYDVYVYLLPHLAHIIIQLSFTYIVIHIDMHLCQPLGSLRRGTRPESCHGRKLYDEMRQKKTSGGCSFAKCIKSGMDNRGHPMIKAVGAVAGDAECAPSFWW